MLFPPDRKLARSKGPWARVVAMVGLAAFSCTFPDYRFEDVATETCDNQVLDGDETGVDCGGDCDSCPSCMDDEDCTGTDQVCEDGDCRGPCDNGECTHSCDDQEQNGDETDEDCGGSCKADCAIGEHCNDGDDCETKVCDETCQPPTCFDGAWNGTEAYEDCGGECMKKCANGQPCLVGGDCVSDTCVEGPGDQPQCAPPFCENRMQDPGETDLNCGGTDCPKCDEGDGCEEGSDCITGVCGENDTCSPPACNDDVWNGAETDKDCGAGCPDCDDGARCVSGEDCTSQICARTEEQTEDRCQVPVCTDGVANGVESDEDCGGNCKENCDLGEHCYEKGDCDSNICERLSEGPGNCVSCDDEQQNGSELGTDCGGKDCALCPPGHDCTGSAGCVNYLCDEAECVNGLELDYVCGQCGEDSWDHIKFSLTLRNLSDQEIDVSDVAIRYYFSTEAPQSAIDAFTFECLYEGSSCGTQELFEYADPDVSTHYLETTIGSDETIPGDGSAQLEITIQLHGNQADQRDDYSFFKVMELQRNWRRITLHRQGFRIWGNEP